LFGLVERIVHLIEQRQLSRPWIHLASDCSQLFRRELLATKVSGQTRHAARDVS
jgi:hypothetical protein